MNTIEDNAYNNAIIKCRCARCSGYDHMGMRVCVMSEGQTCERFRSLREGYIDGAKARKKIDIEKAWQWIENTLFPTGAYGIDVWENDFRKTMEE